jgi:hypothetical protein
MFCLRRKKCEKIINSLIQDYHTRHRKEANNQIAKVDIEHIAWGMANPTSKKLAIEYDYVDKLIDFLFHSLEKDFPKLPLSACKETLIRVVEVEYKNLPSQANTWLMQACMAQQGMIEQYKNGILEKLEKTKRNIENRCELSREKQGQKKWWHSRTNQWIVGIVFMVLLAVIGWLINRNSKIESHTSGNLSPSIITEGPNSPVTVKYEKDENSHRVIPAKVLHVRTKKRVDELEDFLIKEKLTPWRFFRTGKFKVTKYDGKVIANPGVEFEGSLRTFFWEGFIEPFIKDGIQKTLDDVGKECQQNNLDPEPHIKDAASLLRGVISKVYSYMAETDQVLRDKGYPDKVERVDVKDKILKMNEVLDEHVEAALALYSNSPISDKK